MSMIRPKPIIFVLLLSLANAMASAQHIHAHSQTQPVQFTRISPSIDGEEVAVPAREAHRIERFLERVFPVRVMKHAARTMDAPVVRRVIYSVIAQQGRRFVLAGFTARWSEAINVFAIYRMEDASPLSKGLGWPNQVWRSEPWEANYYGLHFWTARVGSRTIILLKEGGAENSFTSSAFSLASVFTFQNTDRGLYIRDLTPSLPMLRAYVRFPFRPLYGQDIALRLDNDRSNIYLSASDEEYHLDLSNPAPPSTLWKYNRLRARFERMRAGNTPQATLTDAIRKKG
jgi:hypothetical protein